MGALPRRWLSGLVAIGLGLLVLSVAGRFSAGAERLQALRAQEAAAVRRLEELKAERARLEAEIRRLQTDEYIETVARQQLGYIRPGEIPYMAVPPTRTGEPEPGAPSEVGSGPASALPPGAVTLPQAPQGGKSGPAGP